MIGRRGSTLEEREWLHDPWDDPDVTDALVIERPRRSHRSVKYLVYLAGMVAVAGLIVAGCVGLWYLRQVNPSGDPGAVEVFKVLPTDTVETISERLQHRGLITNARVFLYYVTTMAGSC